MNCDRAETRKREPKNEQKAKKYRESPRMMISLNLIRISHTSHTNRHTTSTRNTTAKTRINSPVIITDVGNLLFTGDLVHIVGTNIDDMTISPMRTRMRTQMMTR